MKASLSLETGAVRERLAAAGFFAIKAMGIIGGGYITSALFDLVKLPPALSPSGRPDMVGFLRVFGGGEGWFRLIGKRSSVD